MSYDFGYLTGQQPADSGRVLYNLARPSNHCSLIRSRLVLPGSGSRETSDFELSRTDLRSVSRLPKYLTGRAIAGGQHAIDLSRER